MGYFPMCVDLRGRTVLLVGSGPMIRDKMEKLASFGGELVRLDTLEPERLTDDVAFVVAADLDEDALERVCGLCRSRRIPVNVVDDPRRSDFFFPALTVRGDLTVSVSTGGHIPAAAAVLSDKIDALLPADTGRILEELHGLRQSLYAAYPKEEARRMLRAAVEELLEN